MDHFQGNVPLQLLIIHTTSTISVSTAAAISNGCYTDPSNAESWNLKFFFPLCTVCYPENDFFLPIIYYSSQGLARDSLYSILLWAGLQWCENPFISVLGEMCGQGWRNRELTVSVGFFQKGSPTVHSNTIDSIVLYHQPCSSMPAYNKPTESNLKQYRVWDLFI